MDLFAATSRVVSLARSGAIAAARRLFDAMPCRDTVAWNAMLACYSPDAFSLTAALSAAASARDLRRGEQLHALAIALALPAAFPVSNALIDMYGKCSLPSSARQVFAEMDDPNEVSWCSLLSAYASSGWLQKARHLFDEMPLRNAAAWNALMGGYIHHGEVELAASLFREMAAHGVRGDIWTFSSLAAACAELEDPRLGFSLHGLVVKCGWSSAVEIGNSVISFYARLDLAEDAQKVFDALPSKTQVSWNAAMDAHMRAGGVVAALRLFWAAPARNAISWTAVIGGMARNGRAEQALRFFSAMVGCGLHPDELTFTPVLQACAELALLHQGRAAHGGLLRRGFHGDVFLANGLINMYAKCGDVDSSIRAFLGAACRDLVSWNTLLLGLSLHGRAAEAVAAYEEMAEEELSPDGFTFAGLLMGCSHAGLVEQGSALFAAMGVLAGVDHAACVVDMLGRAGRLAEAAELVARWPAAPLRESLRGALGRLGVGRAAVVEELLRSHSIEGVEEEEAAAYVALSNMCCSGGLWEAAAEVRKAMAARGVRKPPGRSWVEAKGKVEAFFAGGLEGLLLPEAEAVLATLRSLESEMRSPSSILSDHPGR
ncbi:unnamed protein product [Spirodela intermedia]|uniref:Uncharacterized protein n=1 Tax=Spirodela intermedia TaxID=51605 RepID=A0A7I8IWN1_SPIIN|nr:unnamed protein product [Spirodela intermedia]CAA6662084.1 unnamed protein product [Spirodela intermedia]